VKVFFAAFPQSAHEFVVEVEVIFDGTLVSARDEQDLLDSVCLQFLDYVLDHGLLGNRQHLLRL
jgi:hypothetical protein